MLATRIQNSTNVLTILGCSVSFGQQQIFTNEKYRRNIKGKRKTIVRWHDQTKSIDKLRDEVEIDTKTKRDSYFWVIPDDT